MDFENWQTQLRKGLLDIAVLNLLQSEEFHGYEMVRRLKRLEGLDVREGNIYPVLARLQSDGLVQTYALASSGGPPRKYYKLTETGEMALRQMNAHWDNLVSSMNRLRSGETRKWTGKTGTGKI